MAFLLASFYEFTLFLKIVLWIAVPLILVSFVITTILHYRQKKKNAMMAEQHPDLPVSDDVDISLVSRLQKEVVHYRRRIRELQHALSFAKDVPPEALKSLSVPNQPADDIPGYPPLLDANGSLSLLGIDESDKLKSGFQGENLNPVISLARPGTGEFDISRLASVSADTIGEGVPDTEQESKISSNALPGDDVHTAREISSTVTFPLSPACLQDIVEEQKKHVRFLQQQLESRIRAFHELEYQFRDKVTSLEKMTLAYEHLRHQLDDTEAATNVARIEKDSLAAQVARLESSLSELQARHTSALKLFDVKSADLKNLIHPHESLANTASKS